MQRFEARLERRQQVTAVWRVDDERGATIRGARDEEAGGGDEQDRGAGPGAAARPRGTGGGRSGPAREATAHSVWRDPAGWRTSDRRRGLRRAARGRTRGRCRRTYRGRWRPRADRRAGEGPRGCAS